MERHARYRAPVESGQKLAVPPWNELGSLLTANVRRRSAVDLEIAGQSLAALAVEARDECLARARSYVGAYAANAVEPVGDPRRPIILTGHQPGLVHPGVWVKNFAAAALAAEHGATACHLIIDADACRSTAIHVPTGSVDEPRLASVEFDLPGSAMPWEERAIRDGDCWRSFPQRTRRATTPLLAEMFLDQWWPLAVERASATGLVGASLAQARHLAELGWGSRNLELPQSQMCQTTAFRRFAVHLLAQLPRFVAVHNGVLADYRRAHRLRNHVHPAPNLAEDAPWLEAPFWLWSPADPRRRPLFVRRQGDEAVLSDRVGFTGSLSLDDVAAAIGQLGDWEAEGVKLRSRALITTLFARLVLSDLFLHGIGGAKYDEATDAISEGFFGVAPPAYAALSGTLHLPIDHPAGGPDRVRSLQGRLRDLQYHPERFAAELTGADADRDRGLQLAGLKRQSAALPKTPENATSRHAAIAESNQGLRELFTKHREQTEAELAHAIARRRANRVLDSREYAFCLFPRNLLEQFLLDFGR